MGLTTDRDDECLNEQKDNGQNECYLILSDEERAKGFVRPVRQTYEHVGRFYEHWESMEMLDEPYKSDTGKVYTAIVTVLTNEDGSRKGGAYLTQSDVDEIKKTKGYLGGCGFATEMNIKLAETYARDPKFYGATFCVGCGTHLPVGEFVWKGTNETVGS